MALFFAFNILLEVLFPTLAWALTDGPKQPEYSGFEPVATTNMVSDFSGAFTYNLPVVNIPGPNGSGYAMSLSYHSGNNSESEASWVGHGWTLNPGAINRNLQGVPDDYIGDEITFFNKRKPNITATVGKKLGVEAYSIDLSADFSYSYNNYRGFGSKLALGLGVGYGLVSLGYSVSGQEPGSFSASVNPGAILKIMDAAGSKKVMASILKDSDGKISKIGSGLKDKINEAADNMKSGKKKSIGRKALDKLGSISFGINSNSFNSVTALNRYNNTCFSMNFEYTNGIDPSLLHIGFEMGYRGSLSYLKNEPSFNLGKTGLLYSSKQDYSVEKESPYNLRDRYLSIPHKAKDQFVITGEMLNGGFSLVDPNLTQAEVEAQDNRVTIFNSGLDVNVGLNIGVGTNVGLGLSTSKVSSFDYTAFPAAGTKPYFRFNNDIGGNVVFSNPDPISGATSTHSFTSSIEAPNNALTSVNYSNMHVNALGQRQGQVGFIGYATFNDRAADAKIYSPTKDAETIALVTSAPEGERISDIYSVNDEGSKLIYGLPVFVSEESQISEDVLEKGNLEDDVPDIFLKNTDATETMLGQYNNGSYATSYLLTQINTSDYIDRTLNGPSNDDFGGWTKFSYRDPAYVASSGKKYRYRSPYYGLSYQQGELTDKEDDLGSCQSGSKEMYYLKHIETKTHIAFFITNKTNINYNGLVLQGTGTDRHDGVEAPSNTEARNAENGSAQKRAEYLERIVVYSKNDLTGKPLSVVNFAYDYSLSPGVLNHKCPGTSCAIKGKLTLTKVWFEYEGVINAKIAPYEFKYAYKTANEFTDQDLKTKYSNIINYGSFTSTEQNPTYKTWALDGWGSYRSDGRDRTLDKEPWVNQSPDEHFDPAAWQLKQIKLPTGGEILIQYEQHDYRYVQDQPALSMVKLAGSDNDLVYELDTASIKGIHVTDNPAATIDNKVEYVKQLNAYLSKEKIYFKFLYSTFGNGDVNNLQNCENEYITGFANANAVLEPTTNKIKIQINGTNNNAPKDVCKWFVKRKVAGKPINQDCDLKNIDLFFPTNTANNNFLEMQSKVVAIVRGATKQVESDFGFANACPSMSMTHSFLRVPVFKNKKAGGVRVKRILMYDQGIETGTLTKDRDEVLYGTEYFYQDKDGLSSGVATNEPNSFREENALVRSLVQRNDPTWKQKMMGGVDRETFEGPLGEQLLPPPSIGYSRVVTQNIHSGKSSTGYKITEFATCREYPFKAKNSSVRAPGSDKYTIPAVIVMIDVERRAAAQSYEFIMNDMHGKLKSIKMYRGSYDQATHQDDKTTFSEIHDYYKLDEKVRVMDASGAIGEDYLGKEETITFENRHAKDEYMGMSTQFDMSVGINFPPPVCIFQFSGMGYVAYSLKEFHTAVFNKTISITSVQKSITTTSDGVTHVQDFRVFNKYNGQPVVVDTYDGYNGLVNLPQSSAGAHVGTIRTHTVPAHYIYKGMGQKVQNEQLEFSGKTFSSNLNKLTVGSDKDYFTEGDLLALTGGGTGLYYVDSKQGNDLMLVKMVRNNVSLGTVVSGPVNVKIINSGYTNQLSSDAASIITYGNSTTIPSSPTSSDVYSGSFDGSVNTIKSVNDVLSASVTLYSNNWVSSYVRGAQTDDDYSLGMKGKWRMKSQVVFNSIIKEAFGGSNKVYNKAGTFQLDPYSFTTTNTNDKWIVSSLVNTYSSDGNMLEDQNALGTKSSSEFSHSNSVPSYIAKNAPLGSCIFRSFEDENVSSPRAHTGQKSKMLLYGLTVKDTIVLDQATKQKEVLVRFWANAPNSVMEDINKNISLNVTDLSNTATINPKITKVAQVGEWTLYEGVVRGLNNYTDNSFTVELVNINSASSSIWLDDFRVQPIGSEMMCYAYDSKSLRLIATFDDQHFALMYQYNGEGKLVRKIVETERGAKTISETQYNVPKKVR